MPVALVIADAEWVVNDVRAALTVGDWEIEAIADPKRAADAVAEAAPDVVLIDLQVGAMGGMAVVRAVRAAFQDDPPRMVLLLDRSADHFIARRARADAAVVKPFLASELRIAVSGEPMAAAPVLAASEEE